MSGIHYEVVPDNTGSSVNFYFSYTLPAQDYPEEPYPGYYDDPYHVYYSGNFNVSATSAIPGFPSSVYADVAYTGLGGDQVTVDLTVYTEQDGVYSLSWSIGSYSFWYLEDQGDFLLHSYLHAAEGKVIEGSEQDEVILAGAFSDYVLGGAGNDQLFGGAGNDALLGGDGNDILEGQSGADVMLGGRGDDTYHVDDAGDAVMESDSSAEGGIDTVVSSIGYVLGSGLENLILSGGPSVNGVGNGVANRIDGNEADNRLDGGDGNDTLGGGAGNDTLIGGSGADSMSGGLGNDTYYVDAAGDIVVESGASVGGGTDTLVSNVSRTLGDFQENLVLTGSLSLNGSGNLLANRISGNSLNNWLSGGGGNDTLSGGSGNDTLSGGSGVDSMSGSLGNDTYYVDAAGDIVIESSNSVSGGVDTLISTVSRVLGNYQENLTLSGSSAINGSGNALSNMLSGNGAANRLSGGEGADTLRGGGGADTLIGGGGRDRLYGGEGGDVFLFAQASDSGPGSPQWDVIADFAAGQDKLDLSQMDAGAVAPETNEAFSFIGEAAFSASDATGQVRYVYDTAGGSLLLYGSTDADTAAEFVLRLEGVSSLSVGDLVL